MSMKHLIDDHWLPQIQGVGGLCNPTFQLPRILHLPLSISLPNTSTRWSKSGSEERHTLERSSDTIGIGKRPSIDWHPNDQFTWMYPLACVEIDGSIDWRKVWVIREKVGLVAWYWIPWSSKLLSAMLYIMDSDNNDNIRRMPVYQLLKQDWIDGLTIKFQKSRNWSISLTFNTFILSAPQGAAMVSWYWPLCRPFCWARCSRPCLSSDRSWTYAVASAGVLGYS